MSNHELIIEERSRDIGDFLVGRLLPFRKKRMVGPFAFIDHMGPTLIKENNPLNVGQHPHIGLSTLTYLFEGEILHKDSLGTVQRISPGSVNWMTAGKGVVHTERTPEDLLKKEHWVHGFQIWVALPKELEDIEPEFHHIEASELPKWKEAGVDFTLIAGTAYGKESPVPSYSPMFMLELKADRKSSFDTGDHLKGEIGICIVKGYIEACDQRIEKGNMLVAKDKDHCKIIIGDDTHLLIFGGAAFDEERYIFWNFVSTEQEKIEIAKERWKSKDFKMISGDKSYIPLPGSTLKTKRS